MFLEYLKYIVIILLFMSCKKDVNNNFFLSVTLKDAPFDTIYLLDYTNGRNIFILGKRQKTYTWEFTIPDSIVSNSENMILRLSNKYDFKNNNVKSVRFFTRRDDEKIIIANIGIEDRCNHITAQYKERNIFSNELISVTVGGKDSIVCGQRISEDFELELQTDSSDITIRASDPFFSCFFDLNKDILSYESYLDRYQKLSKKYPDSRFYMCNLSRMLDRYRSKTDILSIYNNLSEKHKQTLFAKKIERYLSKKFDNISLSTIEQDSKEYIIQDNSKYNLIIFTASWCSPCLDEIPLLKSIYQDLNNLIITYISIDYYGDINNYQQMISQNKIPWRSLLSYNDKVVRDLYFVNKIPHCILVDPNGFMEIIDVRSESDRVKLYGLIKQWEDNQSVYY